MAESTTPAKCSDAVYQAARAAGVLIVTTGEEAAVQKFAEAMYDIGYADGVDSIATGEAPRYALLTNFGDVAKALASPSP